MRTGLIFFFSLAFNICVYSQLQDTVHIRIHARNMGDKALLRWAVTTPRAWKTTNRSGFMVERYTIARGKEVLPEQERKQLTPFPLKAAPVEQWEMLAQKDQYAAVVAQSLFGETFEITGMTASDGMEQIVRESEALEQRHTFSLFAADMSFDAACLAGWGLTDNEVVKGERYLYRVIPASDSIPYTTEGYGFIVMDDYKELPPPVYFSATFGDRSALLSWNARLQKSLFVSYWIEKSEDGENFNRLEIPVVSLQESAGGYLIYSDSLDRNDKTYYYRVRGQSPFGEISKPSEIVSGKGTEELKATPQIVRYYINETGSAEIEWEFDPQSNHLIRSFSLRRALSDTSVYETVVKDIPPVDRHLVFDRLQPSNYFVISAEPVHGAAKESFPVLLIPVDSVPPLAPTGLQASIDSLGTVSLTWNPNKETDILGYKIYRGNTRGEELIAIQEEPLTGNACTDTVNLNDLNTHVCYYAIAFDKRYNQSAPSDTLFLEKPLLVRPSSPVLSSCESTSGGIVLNWINCPDKDIIKHTLYRLEKDSSVAEIAGVFDNPAITQYKDSLIRANTQYTYTITATGKRGVESRPSPPVSIRSKSPSGIKMIKSFTAKINKEIRHIDLEWQVAFPEKVDYFKIYRSENDRLVSLWKEIPADKTQFTDETAQPGAKQNYLIIAILKGGGESNRLTTSIIF